MSPTAAAFTIVIDGKGEERLFVGGIADVFTYGTCTISRLEDEEELKVFAKRDWKTATTYSPDGHPLYCFMHPEMERCEVVNLSKYRQFQASADDARRI